MPVLESVRFAVDVLATRLRDLDREEQAVQLEALTADIVPSSGRFAEGVSVDDYAEQISPERAAEINSAMVAARRTIGELRPCGEALLRAASVELAGIVSGNMREWRAENPGTILSRPMFGVKIIDPEKLHISPRGVIAVKGKTVDGKGKQHVIVLRASAWAVRDLFPFNARFFVTAGARLNMATGAHATDREFPGYLGKFILQDQGRIVVFDDEVESARRILGLSYSGKEWGVTIETVARSYPEGADVPNLDAEFRALEAPYPVTGEGGIWDLKAMQPGGAFEFEGWRIEDLGGGKWRVFEDGEYLGDIDVNDYPIETPRPVPMENVGENAQLARRRRDVLMNGKPTVVPLGSGSGFTKEEASSHLTVDENGDVTITDPNVNVIEDIVRLGIGLDRVKRIFISHVHFDHVAGLWRLIRRLPHKADLIINANPGDIEAIRAGGADEGEMSSLKTLIAMAVHATGKELTGEQIMDAVNIVPTRYLQGMDIGSFRYEFFHTNHTVPTTGYKIVNKSTGRPVFLFTGDTRLAREELEKKGAIGEARIKMLADMVAETLIAGGIVYGDAGVPGVHPTVGYYTKLFESFAGRFTEAQIADMKSRLYLMHASRAEVEKAGFRYAGFGWGDSVDLSEQAGWTSPGMETAMAKLVRRGLENVPVLNRFNSAQLDQLARLGRVRHYGRGANIMKQGDRADTIHIILDGALQVTRTNGEEKVLATLTSGLVGEAVLMDNNIRNANAKALTGLMTLELRQEGVEFLKANGIVPRLVSLREFREKSLGKDGTVEVLSELAPATRDAIFLSGEVVSYKDGEVIIREGDHGRDFYVVFEGEVEISAASGALAQHPIRRGKGAVLGEGTLLGGAERSATIRAAGDVQLLHLDERSAKELLDAHGGDLRYYLLGLVQERGSVRHAGGGTPTPAGGGGGLSASVLSGLRAPLQAIPDPMMMGGMLSAGFGAMLPCMTVGIPL